MDNQDFWNYVLAIGGAVLGWQWKKGATAGFDCWFNC